MFVDQICVCWISISTLSCDECQSKISIFFKIVLIPWVKARYMCFRTNSVSQMFSPTEIFFFWLLRSQSTLWAKIPELTKRYFWNWQLIIFSLEYQHINHSSDCNYCSYLSINSSRQSPFSLELIASSPEQQAVSAGKALEPALGQFQCGWAKRKLLYVLPVLDLTDPVLDLSDPMAASSPPAQQPGLALRRAGCIQCCVANTWNCYGFLCLPKLPPTRPQTPLRASEALQELWGISILRSLIEWGTSEGQ